MQSPVNPLRSTSALLVTCALLLAAQPSFATFKSALGLTNFNPDIFVSGLSLSYTASTGLLSLTATNQSGSFTDAAGSFAGAGSVNYSLTADLSGNGSVLDSGSLSITAGSGGFNVFNVGTIAADTVMLNGTIFDFGVSGGGDGSGTFEFLLGGLSSNAPELGLSLDSFALSIASTAGGALDGFSDNSWLAGNVDFSGTALTSDTSVPLPATWLLVGLGLVGLGALRRHQALRADS